MWRITDMSAKRQNRTLLLTPELTSGQRTKDSECGLYDQKRDEINDVGVVEAIGSFLSSAIRIPRVLLPHDVELRLLLVAQ